MTVLEDPHLARLMRVTHPTGVLQAPHLVRLLEETHLARLMRVTHLAGL